MELLIFLILLTLYFIPVIIASNRSHNNLTPILLVTILFGWTGLGWLVAFIWAFSSNVGSK